LLILTKLFNYFEIKENIQLLISLNK